MADAPDDLTLHDLRPEVVAMAIAMERKLRDNDHKPGWKQDSAGALFERLKEEVGELGEVIAPMAEAVYRGWPDYGRGGGTANWAAVTLGEAADVANFAMMIADVRGALPVADTEETPRAATLDQVAHFEERVLKELDSGRRAAMDGVRRAANPWGLDDMVKRTVWDAGWIYMAGPAGLKSEPTGNFSIDGASLQPGQMGWFWPDGSFRPEAPPADPDAEHGVYTATSEADVWRPRDDPDHVHHAADTDGRRTSQDITQGWFDGELTIDQVREANGLSPLGVENGGDRKRARSPLEEANLGVLQLARDASDAGNSYDVRKKSILALWLICRDPEKVAMHLAKARLEQIVRDREALHVEEQQIYDAMALPDRPLPPPTRGA